MHREGEKFKQLLRGYGVSVTVPRQALFKTLLDSDEPLRKAEIATRTPSVDRATVYRSLQLFDELGITTTLIRGWTPFIELATPFKPHHHHLQCTRCEELIELDNSELEVVIDQLASAHGYKLTAHHIELSGVCPQCARDKTTTKH